MTTQVDEKKIWKKEEIRELLDDNDNAVLRGILVIYSLQTEEEKKRDETLEHNGVGFSGVDSTFMSSLAKWILQHGGLSEKQMHYGRKKIKKYARQLADVANGKIKISI